MRGAGYGGGGDGRKTQKFAGVGCKHSVLTAEQEHVQLCDRGHKTSAV